MWRCDEDVMWGSEDVMWGCEVVCACDGMTT